MRQSTLVLLHGVLSVSLASSSDRYFQQRSTRWIPLNKLLPSKTRDLLLHPTDFEKENNEDDVVAAGRRIILYVPKSVSHTKITPKNRPATVIEIKEKSVCDAAIRAPLQIRGGSIRREEQQEEAREAGIIVKKLRNVIRSLLEVTERKSPPAAKVFRHMVKFFESMTGVGLLPQTKDLLGQKKKKKSKGSSSMEASSENVKTTKKKKKKKTTNKLLEEETDSNNTPMTSTKSNSLSSSKKARPETKASSHLARELKSNNPNYRIQRELREFIKSPPPNLKVSVGKNMRIWIVHLTGAKNTIYDGETYRLRIAFPSDYPTNPPSVYFLQPTPRHEHVYTNGDICLSLLGKDWRPTMTAQSVSMSILSILSGAQRKSLPMDNARHAGNKPGGRQDDWVYHDDNC